MATDVDVQFFSHLNGLVLGNNWGDMIRLLDTCLVNGLPLTSITSATIDAQGDINLTLFAAHKCLLFQIIELSGFAPSGINGKYRIKGTPTATTLILKAGKVGQTITTTGTAKLASLGYEIKFRDLNDVKRAYRAIGPTDAHPFIRVDESLSGEGGGTYTSTYAKSAMVGLIENMTHIDDYADTSKLQLPLDTTDFTKNWKIVGTGSSVVRGWSRWYWSKDYDFQTTVADSNGASADNKKFTIVGDKDAFYALHAINGGNANYKVLNGCGLFQSSMEDSVIPPWFLMTTLSAGSATLSVAWSGLMGGLPLLSSETSSRFFVPTFNPVQRVYQHAWAAPIIPSYRSGWDNLYNGNNIAALDVPFADGANRLRGTLKHVAWAGQSRAVNGDVLPLIGDNSMYIYDSAFSDNQPAGFYFYLGEL